MTGPRLIVFSDLDGTLLDHDTYALEAARPALERLKAEGHALVLASSKTAAEIAPIRRDAGFSHCPAIVENGAGLLAPGEDGMAADSAEHDAIMAVLNALPAALRRNFSGFSDWSVDEVMERTGLPRISAERARLRRFSEPGIWSGDEASRTAFIAALTACGLTAVTGGRYFTLSFGKTKASQMDELMVELNPEDVGVISVALGDAPNDIAMLEKADVGIIIANPAHGGLPVLPGESTGRIIRSQLPGPAGWNEEILRILDTL